MIGTSAIIQEEYSNHYLIPESYFTPEKKGEEAVSFTDLELFVTDCETGRPVSMAMISIDMIGRTAVCDVQGKVLITQVLAGDFIVDVIVHGYIANSTKIHLSVQGPNRLNVKMVRNC